MGFGSVGPCGPSNLLGALFFVYMMPACYVSDVLHMGDIWTWITAIILHTTLWSLAWLGILRFTGHLKAKRPKQV
jgi:hypothetical protein